MPDDAPIARGVATSAQVTTLEVRLALIEQERSIRLERERELDEHQERRITKLGEQINELVERLRTLEEAVRPLVRAFEGQQADSRQFNASLKLALISAIATLMIIGVIGPEISHLLFGK